MMPSTPSDVIALTQIGAVLPVESKLSLMRPGGKRATE
jgi:hypothetical protein